MTLPSNVNALRNYAHIARGRLEVFAHRENIPGTELLRGYCAIGSRSLWMMAIHLNPLFCSGVFRQYDRKSRKYKDVSGHCWLELNGYIVDITATQFTHAHTKVKRDFSKSVYITKTDNPHYQKTHSGTQAFEAVRNWHEYPLDDLASEITDITPFITRKRKKSK